MTESPPERSARTAPVPVLVADDHPSERMAIRAALGGLSYEIVEASSPDEVLRHLLGRDFAVLLLDVVMPGMDGIELAQLIRERPRATMTPILFLTGRAYEQELIDRAYGVGAIDYLVKPIRPTVLRAKVEVLAELYRHRLGMEEQARRAVRTEQREAELTMRELRLASERHYRNLADAVPNIVWTGDPAGRVEYYNRRWFEFTGLRAADRPRPWFSELHSDDRERARAAWEAAVSEDRMLEGEFRLRAADGSYRWQLCRATPEIGPSGKVVSWMGTFTDIEETKQAEREREELHAKTVEALQARDEFLSVASHELKTPVSSLRLQLQLILRRLCKDPDYDRELEAKVQGAGRQVDKLARLIVQLLDVSRLRAGRDMDLEREELDLRGLAQEILGRFKEDAAQAGSELRLAAPSPVHGNWDRLRIDQVLTNFLTNALKFGKGRPIDVEVGKAGEEATIVVRDRGIGIAPGDHERIFERFERTGEAKAIHGMGLGLYIVRRIVEAHGGTIRVESRLGEGTAFYVKLPLS